MNKNTANFYIEVDENDEIHGHQVHVEFGETSQFVGYVIGNTMEETIVNVMREFPGIRFEFDETGVPSRTEGCEHDL